MRFMCLTQDQLICQVIQGGGNMPAYGNNLSPAETTALISFLDTLYPHGSVPARDASASQEGASLSPNREFMSPEVKAVFVEWSAPVPVTLILVVTAFVYSRGWFHLSRVLPIFFSVRQLGAFITGLFALWIAVGSPLAAFDDALLTIHMVQHILLMAVAPPLILIGAPALPLLDGLPKRFVRRILGPVLRWDPCSILGAFSRIQHFVGCPPRLW